VERRGDRGDHAWAELTWIKFVKFMCISWVAGVLSGLVFFAIGAYTTIYHGILAALGAFVSAYPYVTAGALVFGCLIIYVGIKVDRHGRRRKTVNVPMVIQ
jgi:uncharacterized membrane protein